MAKIFDEMLPARWAAGGRVCVGLDSDIERLPTHLQGNPVGGGRQLLFNKKIIDASRTALALKPNIGFYTDEEDDPAARMDLRASIEYVRDTDPQKPVILDEKRMDIGNTNKGYVKEIRYFSPDAVTINPYLGKEAALPFLEMGDVGMFVLCRTSNPGAEEYQELMIRPRPHEAERWGISPQDEMPLYQYVAYQVSREWNKISGNCGLVVGATYPEQLGEVRRIVGDDMWILCPGIGTQKGDLGSSMRHGLNSRRKGLVFSSSSAVIFADDGVNFDDHAQEALFRQTGEMDAILRSMTP